MSGDVGELRFHHVEVACNHVEVACNHAEVACNHAEVASHPTVFRVELVCTHSIGASRCYITTYVSSHKLHHM